MTYYTTTTREFGEITFSAPAATESKNGYVWLEYGKRRDQICYGGDFRGTTVAATTTDLKRVAQQWMRQRREWQRKMGA